MSTDTGFKHKIRDFLFRCVNREFLVISGIFWFVLAVKEPMEKELLIPVTITHVPQNVVLNDSGSDTLRVVVRDNGYTIFGYMFQSTTPIVINFNNYVKGDGHNVVPASEVMKLVKAQLERSTQVLSVKPEKLDIYYYNDGDSKRVPVEIYGKWTADYKSFIVNTQAKPDSVTVYASPEHLGKITKVRTQYFTATDVSEIERLKVPLQKVSGVKFKPDIIDVEVRADILTEGSVEVPVVAVGVPDDKVLRTFPSTVTVGFATGANLLSQVDASLFRVEVRYDEIDDSNGTRYLKLHLEFNKETTHFIQNVKLSQNSVDYLVEQR